MSKTSGWNKPATQKPHEIPGAPLPFVQAPQVSLETARKWIDEATAEGQNLLMFVQENDRAKGEQRVYPWKAKLPGQMRFHHRLIRVDPDASPLLILNLPSDITDEQLAYYSFIDPS